MKIYTKTGDKGKTSLVSGRGISKSDALIEAYGTVDELNAFVGALIDKISEKTILDDLEFIQNMLFNIGSVLAKDDAKFPDYPVLLLEDIQYLEKRIDELNGPLEKMTAFILPVGSASIAYAHICRTICRRAERRIIGLSEQGIPVDDIVVFLNRLSDYFFILARHFHLVENIPEHKWDNNIRAKHL